MTIYPSILDYQRSIQESVGSFSTLTDVHPLLDLKNRVKYVAGNRAVIFRVTINSKEYALKCYTSNSKHNFEHYKKLGQAIMQSPFSAFVPFEVLEDELLVQNCDSVSLRYSVILMPWLEGELLSSLVSRLCYLGKRDELHHLASLFCRFAIELLESGYTHGDIKPDNIIVEPSGHLRLIDLDAVGFQAVYNTPQRELGTLWYQHPRGRGEVKTSHQDDYSIAIITASLYMLAKEPYLLERHTNGENMIFDTRTLMQPNNWHIASALSQAEGNAPLQQLIYMLVGPSYKIPKLLNVLKQCAGVFEGYLSKADIGAIYDDSMPETYGCVAVKSGCKWAYINLDQKSRTQFLYDEAQPFSCNLATARCGNRWHVLDLNFKSVFYLECDTMLPFRDNIAIIGRGGLFGAVDVSGCTIIECTNVSVSQLTSSLFFDN